MIKETPEFMSSVFVYGAGGALLGFVLANFMAMAIIHWRLWEPKLKKKRGGRK